ncbi:surface-adhesin E family protein [Paraburkholderia sp. EG285A]|uniref:surface-adhesin E family protein n=1 Tax=Paraburkholderia sp. EG285A TaxID=3237009 RepID=UPI0034D36084
MIRKLMVVAVIGCNAVPAFASDWRQIYTDSGATVSVDAPSFSKNGSIVHAWLRQDYAKVQATPAGQPYDSAQSRVEINCDSWKMATSSSIGLYKGQESTKFQTSGYEDIFPDSYIAKAVEALCKAPS